MAKKERSGLGRGLGALLPSAAQDDVSRETIRSSHPLDSLVPAREDGAKASREHADVTKKLLMPDTSKRRQRGKTAGSAAKSGTGTKSGTPTKSEAPTKGSTDTKPRSTGRSPSTKASSTAVVADTAPTRSGGAKAKASPVADSKQTASGGTAKKAGSRKPLFADIIGDAQSADSPSSVGTGSESAGGKSLEDRSAASDHTATTASGAGAADGATQSLSGEVELMPVPGATFAHIPVSAIAPNRRQPRDVFDEDELSELAESINEIGVLQPIVVRPLPAEEGEAYLAELSKRLDTRSIEELGLSAEDGNWYELVMGERRLRASKLAGAETIPAIIRSTADNDMLRDALLENLHRSQLNPIEEAAAYQQLMEDFECTQQELSDRIARSRSQIANTIRLLKLPSSVQRKLAAGVISAGHARALLSLDSTSKMGILADRIIAEGLSVRATEEIVAIGDVSDTPAQKRAAKRAVTPASEVAKMVTDQLEDLFETRVKIVEGRRKGRIIIEFAGSEDLDRMAVMVNSLRRSNQ